MHIKKSVFLLLFFFLGVKGLNTSLEQIFENKGLLVRQRNQEGVEINLFVLSNIAQEVQKMVPLKKIKALVRVRESFSPDLYFEAIIEKKEQNILWVYPPISFSGTVKKAFIGSPATIVPGFEVKPGLVQAKMLKLSGKKDIQGRVPKERIYSMPQNIQIRVEEHKKKAVQKVIKGQAIRQKAKIFVFRPNRPKMFFNAVVEREKPGVVFIYPERARLTIKERFKGRTGRVEYGYKLTELDQNIKVVPLVTPENKGLFSRKTSKGVHEVYPSLKPVPSAPPLLYRKDI